MTGTPKDIRKVDQINIVADFLASEDIEDLKAAQPVDCIVLCVSAILHCAEVVFDAVRSRPQLTKTLVLCGGIGHSTPFLYEAVKAHPKWKTIYGKINGLPEAQVLAIIYNEFYRPVDGVRPKVLVEDKSTNCGANAIETRKLLSSEILDDLKNFIIVQDPTMSRRTIASFQKAYSDMAKPPVFSSCPIFVPRLQCKHRSFFFDIPGINGSGLWNIDRFFDLVMGEIPRLRDDTNGYGPKGKGFIGHVDIPAIVEGAYCELSQDMSSIR